MTTVPDTIDLRERELCSVALEMLAEVGYEALSMDALARRAKASKATIYRRWASKGDLVVDALRFADDRSCATPDTGELRGDLIAAARSFGDVASRNGSQLFSSVARAARDDDKLCTAVRDRLAEPRRRVTQQIVAAAIARGELPASAADIPLAHDLLPALLMVRVSLQQPLDEDFYASLVDTVLLPVLRQAS